MYDLYQIILRARQIFNKYLLEGKRGRKGRKEKA